jgi:hypothetical protein
MSEKRKYEVLLKRVSYQTAIVEANSAKEARSIVDQDGPHEHFLMAQILGADDTRIVTVKLADRQ